jgi:hypothetical protein
MSAARIIPFPPDSIESQVTMQRFRAEYKAAESAAALAESLKYASWAVACVVFIFTLLIHQSLRSERFGFPVISLSLLGASALMVLAAGVWDRLARTRARRRRAAIDAAVNASPLLSNLQRAELTGLVHVTAPGAGAKKAA